MVPAGGAAGFSAASFGSVTVLENGRKKPFDTFARNKLLQYSGKRRLAESSALQWLCRVLFTPEKADFDKVFLINNPEVARTLGIPPERKRRYSYAALSAAAEALQRYYNAARKTSADRQSSFDREILRIYTNLIDYRSLASTFSFLLPDPVFHIEAADTTPDLPRVLIDPHMPPSFLDMLRLQPFLARRMTAIRNTGTDSLTAVDHSIIEITRTMYAISSAAENTPPHLIPVREKGDDMWYSPWGCIAAQRSKALSQPALQALITIYHAYGTGNQKRFDDAVTTFSAAVRSSLSAGALPDTALELFYNRLGAFFIAKIILGIAALFALAALFSRGKTAARCSTAGIAAGWLLCTTGIILRMIIMRHPPVTNLYETFIFVAWATIIIGLILEFLRIRSIGLLTASLSGFIFLHVAGRFAADGDTLGMLAAVLDSGFWLTTHIITIALGYAGCLGAGFIAHVYLLHRVLRAGNQERLGRIAGAVYGVFAFGMLFTVTGTVTGGMWADQAWGRFWGWDPKENGALLIILWCMIVFHARRGRMIADTGMAIGAIIAAMLVMCTWIGVNLLGTGLHSYGFTASGAKLLFGYTGGEMIFLGIIGIIELSQRKRVPKR